MTDIWSIHGANVTEEAVMALVRPHRGPIYGPLIVGLFLDAVLAGVFFIQAIHWLMWSPAEKVFVKCIIAASAIVTYATTFFNIGFAFNQVIYGFGKYIRVVDTNFTPAYRAFDALSAACVQVFLIDRAAKSSGWPKTIYAIFVPLTVASVGASIASLVGSVVHHTSARDLPMMVWTGYVIAVNIVLGTITTISSWRTGAGWSAGDSVIARANRVSLEAQVVSILVSIACIVTYTLKGGYRITLFFDMTIGKIFIVNLMALLNSRINLKSEGQDPDDSFFGKQSRVQNARVMVSTEVYTESHQLQHLPPVQMVPRDADTKARFEEETESEVDIRLDVNGSRTGLTSAPAIKFQDVL